MKIGDLVKDIDPSYTGQHGVGIVVDVDTDLVGTAILDGHILVKWFDGFGSGVVPENHKYLELVSECIRNME